MSVEMNDVLDQIGTALEAIEGVQVWDWVPGNAVTPFLMVDTPDSIDYDLTYGRGADRMTVRVFLAVTQTATEFTRDALGEYAGSGPKSVKAAIESADIGQSTRVTRVEFAPVSLAGTTYAGAVFTVDVQA